VVSLDQIGVEYNGVALALAKKLYPEFSLFPVSRCSYSTLGLIRYYSILFNAPNVSNALAKVAVPTADPQPANSTNSPDQKDGYEQVSV